MHASGTQHFLQQRRSTVGDFALLGEIRGGMHEDGDPQDLLHLVERSQLAAQDRKGAQRAEPRRALPVGERNLGAQLSGDDYLVTHARDLSADEDFAAVAQERNVASADFHLGVDVEAVRRGQLLELCVARAQTLKLSSVSRAKSSSGL